MEMVRVYPLLPLVVLEVEMKQEHLRVLVHLVKDTRVVMVMLQMHYMEAAVAVVLLLLALTVVLLLVEQVELAELVQ